MAEASHEHPFLKWVGIGTTIAGVIAACVAVAIHIRVIQDELHGLQSSLDKLNNRVHRLSKEHADIQLHISTEAEGTRSAMTTANDDLNYRLGFHRGKAE